MDIRQIRYFLTVAKSESFSKAAQALYITQPVLTRCIQDMEQELGVTLIHRSTKQFRLTEPGKLLQQEGAILLEQHNDLIRKLRDTGDLQGEELTIASPGVLLDMYFPELVSQYRSQHPLTHLKTRECGSRQVVQEILAGAADIGLVMLPLEDAGGLEVFPIIQDEVHVVVPRDHPFAVRESLAVEDLNGQDILTYDQSNTLYHSFWTLCRKAGFQPVIVCQSMMPNFILDTLCRGSCVGVLPAPMLRQFPRQELVSIPLRPVFPWQIAMITKKGRYLSNGTESFLRFVREKLAAIVS